MTDLSRRVFFRALCAAGLAGASFVHADESGAAGAEIFDSWAAEPNLVRFWTSRVSKPVRLMFLSDTHLFLDDQRGEPFRQYSDRMAHAYNKTKHYKTGAETDPAASFLETLEKAKKWKADAIVMLGDMVSFPSEAGVEWLVSNLDAAGIPWYYVAGNHDWHYEGLPGSDEELRREWAPKRLSPLYRGRDPLMSAVDIGELRLLLIDDSIYEILPEQLDFFCRQVQTGKPLVLGMHIPLYAPGRSVGFGCGHPDWNAEHDENYKIERREKWRASGHTPVTCAFRREVFTAPNLLAVFAGHVHGDFLDVQNGHPQFVVPTNSNGNHTFAGFLPK